MKILIAGANGYLGSALKRDLSGNFVVRGTYGKNPQQYLLPMDVTDSEQVMRILTHERPDVVINSVGISGKFKQDPDYATQVNIEGTRNITSGARRIGAKLIHISSTAVFNGQDGPFRETDIPGTTDQYGKTKIETEKIVGSSGINHLIIRPSLIVGDAPYGMTDKFPGQLVSAISTDTPLAIDNEWRFAPSYTHHISDVIGWWINHPESTDLLHVVSSETTTKFQFAQRLCNKLGIAPTMIQEKESSGPSGNNILDNSRLIELGAPTISLEDILTETATEIRNPRTLEGLPKRTKESE